MAAELDHIFICVSPDATVEASALLAFGLREGPSNTHPGQGTACRRFVFRNAYLELLWVNNPTEAQSPMVQPTHLGERWAGRERACPFGLGFRPKADQSRSPPFPSWAYCPPYLPESWSIQVGTNATALAEPMLFYLSFGQRPDTRPGARSQDLEHPAGLREITRIELVGPTKGESSPALSSLSGAGLLGVRAGARHLIELGFDGEGRGRVADFRPALPLAFRW
jgi:hypothetical protein